MLWVTFISITYFFILLFKKGINFSLNFLCFILPLFLFMISWQHPINLNKNTFYCILKTKPWTASVWLWSWLFFLSFLYCNFWKYFRSNPSIIFLHNTKETLNHIALVLHWLCKFILNYYYWSFTFIKI